ncbi:M23 family metallopeptidase, partial [Nocardioides sp.]|uniref:M23 family metallopeptidase n=1 Tax=Nocardioides sp. TaxID=35761 RepID=UPI002735426D
MAPRSSDVRRAAARAAGLATALAAVLAGPLVTATPAAASTPTVGYEMPFGCSQQWTGTTRKGHSPSVLAVDWNRPGDLGLPVTAAAAGRVSTAHAKVKGGYGKWVVIDHGGGEATLYAHLKSVRVVLGQTVDQGDLIGTVGATGNASGAHLHYERKLSGKVAPAWFAGSRYVYGTNQASGNCVDVPLAGNFAGDRAAELVVYRRSAGASFVVRRPGQADQVLRLGRSVDRPVLGDWNGDGVVDPGVRKGKGKAFVLRSPAG